MNKCPRRSKQSINILVAATDNMMGESLASAFRHPPGTFAVMTLIGSSDKIIRELEPLKLDIALLCAELDDGPLAGFRVLQELRNLPHQIIAVMLLQRSEAANVVRAFREGARGVFYRTHPLKGLSKCIQTVHQGQVWIGNEDVEHILNALVHPTALSFHNREGQPIFTRREEGVVLLVAEGLKNREIAQRLNVAEHTIRNYLCRIFEKLGVSTRVELILYAFSQLHHSNYKQ